MNMIVIESLLLDGHGIWDMGGETGSLVAIAAGKL